MSEKFLALGLQPDLVKALDEMNFVQPTPIQEQTIPAALKGDNVVGRSATGTGKTLAYLLPILQKIDPESSAVQAVIWHQPMNLRCRFLIRYSWWFRKQK
jgi:superfamily II DNA/RNA helicase